MKTTPLTYQTGIISPALEVELEANQKKILEQAKEKGLHYAKQNRPEPKGDTLDVYVSDLTTQYEEMVVRSLQTIQPESAGAEAKMIRDETSKKVKAYQQKKQEAEINLHNLELDLKQSGITFDQFSDFKKPKNFNIILAIIVCSEVFFNTGSLQLIGDNLIMSLIISAGITGALFFLAKQVAKYMKENSADAKTKKIVAIGASLLALGIFFLLATLRAEHIKEKAHYSISPIFLVLVNILFYVVTVWHFFRNTQSPEEKDKQAQLASLKEKWDGYKQQITENEEKQTTIEQETADKLKLLISKPAYAKRLTERINRWSIEAVEVFKSTNLANRSDRKVPDCFRRER